MCVTDHHDMTLAVKVALNPQHNQPRDKILGLTKLKAFADHKIKIAQMMVSLFDRIGNIVGKALWSTAFSPFPPQFSKGFFLGGCLKSELCGNDLNVTKMIN